MLFGSCLALLWAATVGWTFEFVDSFNLSSPIRLRRPLSNTAAMHTTDCHVDYKVYVYDIATALLAPSLQARRERTYHVCQKCIFEQFALEFVVNDYFDQFCGRTLDPSEADFFFLPLTRDLDYRISMATGKGKVSSVVEEVLIAAIERQDFSRWREVLNVTDEYWRRSNGSDHIFVMPAPVTNFRHQSNMRGFFHYMPQLAAPIFLNVEFSRSFVDEYPVCAGEKNLVLPYPTTDPDLFGLRFYSHTELADGPVDAASVPSDQLALIDADEPERMPRLTKSRSKLVFYHGGMHGSCTHVRQALNDIMHNEKALVINKGDRKREQGFLGSTFCPIPVGDSPSSKRMYDALNFGCIPVLLSDDALWAFSREAGGPLDVALFSITLPQRTVLRTPKELLTSLSLNDSTSALTHEAVNGGMSLPRGQSLVQLLRELAEEDAKQAMVEPNDSEDSKANAKPKAAAATVALPSNTLMRLLAKISTSEVRRLRANALAVSHLYRFYSLNSSLPHSAPPLTAMSTFPTGGAISMLDAFLSNRKRTGVDLAWSQCQRELSRKHKYIGRYPCEKRRRLRATGQLQFDEPCESAVEWRRLRERSSDSADFTRFFELLEAQSFKSD